MAYLNDLQYYLDSSSIGLLLELILVTTCISTIIFFTTKNKYISYLASAPIFYFILCHNGFIKIPIYYSSS